MAVQTYLVQLSDGVQDDDGTREAVADVIHGVGGFVLMGLATGALIVAFDDHHLAMVQAHRHVSVCGGVTLDPRGAAADQLRKVFAHNVAAQLADRGVAGAQPPRSHPAYPPGYRPLQFRQRYE